MVRYTDVTIDLARSGAAATHPGIGRKRILGAEHDGIVGQPAVGLALFFILSLAKIEWHAQLSTDLVVAAESSIVTSL